MRGGRSREYLKQTHRTAVVVRGRNLYCSSNGLLMVSETSGCAESSSLALQCNLKTLKIVLDGATFPGLHVVALNFMNVSTTLHIVHILCS